MLYLLSMRLWMGQCLCPHSAAGQSRPLPTSVGTFKLFCTSRKGLWRTILQNASICQSQNVSEARLYASSVLCQLKENWLQDKTNLNQWSVDSSEAVPVWYLSNRPQVSMGYINNSRHLARKYARIFVHGHYLFWEANSFARAKLEENCELRGTDNVQGQIS